MFFIARWRQNFLQPSYEWGDACSNSLQILDAKVFRELYANYSRWKFHHPGPAFFYVFAWGEILLHDLLHISPTSYSAQLTTSALLQFFFYALGISILARRLRDPWIAATFLPIYWIHMFAAMNTQFDSWSVFILLGPFFCFFVACASVSLGSIMDILPALLAGGFLFQGYVAQPLFVIPTFLAALVCLYRQARDSVVEPLTVFQKRALIWGATC